MIFNPKEEYEKFLSKLDKETVQILPITKFNEDGNISYHESEEDYLARMERDYHPKK